MSIVETILVFVLAPAGLIAVIALMTFVPGGARSARYRPGRDWPYEPVWYAPHPLAVHDGGDHDPGHRGSHVGQGELTPGSRASTPSARSLPEPTAGGARGTW